jgi:DNA repair exonuclease SbcCD nuclease subunit
MLTKVKANEFNNKKELKIGIIGDLHLSHFLPYTDRASPLRKKALIRFMEILSKKFIKYNVDLILVAGDVCHSAKLNSDDLFLLMSFLRIFSELKIPKYIIPGNHDLSGNLSILDFLKKDDEFSFHYYDEPCCKSFGSYSICLIPYMDSSFVIEEVDKCMGPLPEFGKYSNSILVLHTGVKGAKHGSLVSMDGIDSVKFAELSKKFTLVVMGHYHKFQIVTPNSLFTGALHQTRSDEIKTIPGGTIVSFPSLEYIRIHNQESPRFVEIREENFFEISESKITKNIVHLYLKGEMSPVESDELIFTIKKFNPYNLIVHKEKTLEEIGRPKSMKTSSRNKRDALWEVLKVSKAEKTYKEHVLKRYTEITTGKKEG